MNKRPYRAVAAGAIALCAGMAWAQEQPPSAAAYPPGDAVTTITASETAPGAVARVQRGIETSASTYDTGHALDLSQENNPEVAIAEAQLREAEARLRQARMQAAQNAVEITHIRKVADIARNHVKDLETRTEAGVASHQELLEAQERLAEAEAALARQETGLKALQLDFRGGFGGMGGAVTAEPRMPFPRPELNKEAKTEVEKSLEAPISTEFSGESLSAISAFISEYAGVNIVIDVALQAAQMQTTIKLADVPLRDSLLALADVYGDLCFVIRDYGIFATTPERAMTINAPTIPSNIPLYLPMQEATAGRHTSYLSRYGSPKGKGNVAIGIEGGVDPGSGGTPDGRVQGQGGGLGGLPAPVLPPPMPEPPPQAPEPAPVPVPPPPAQ